MGTRVVGSFVAVAIAATIFAVSLHAQRGTAPRGSQTGSRPIPRAADGKPDLSGIWVATSALRLMVGDAATNAILAADKTSGRPPAPPAEPPPYHPAAEKQRQEFLARRGIDDPMALCYLSGVPRISFRPLPFQIVQLPTQVILLYEVHHAFRIIPTDGRPHPDDVEPSFLGDSVAHWEGGTLVVDVTSFNLKTWLSGVGTIHSEKLHVTERYTRDTFDTIRYEVTLQDPDVFTKPWHLQETFRLRPNDRLREYECIENNEDLVRLEKLMQTESIFRRPQ